MERVRVPTKKTVGGHTYIYQKQTNDNVFLYKEEKYGWNECFLLQDLVKTKIVTPNSPFHKDKKGKKKYEI